MLTPKAPTLDGAFPLRTLDSPFYYILIAYLQHCVYGKRTHTNNTFILFIYFVCVVFLWLVVFVLRLCYCFEFYLRIFSDPSKFDVLGLRTDVMKTHHRSGRIQLLWVIKGDRHGCGVHREGHGPSIQGPYLSLNHDPSYSTVDVSKILMQAYLYKKKNIFVSRLETWQIILRD